jgi:hypothetical protein
MGGSRSHLLLAVALLVGCNEVPTAPTLSIEPAEPTTTDDLSVQITADAVDSGRILFYRTVWSRDGQHVLALDDETSVPAAETTRDEVWSVEVSAVDDELDLGVPGTAEVTVANSPPTAQVSITPSSPTVSQDLVASVTTTDADDDEVSASVTWTVDGEPRPDLDGLLTVPATATEAEQTWTVILLPDDGIDTGDAVSASVTIGADTRPAAFTFCSGGGLASNTTTSGVLCASPLDLATTPASNGKLVWYPGPMQAIAP